jgi:hypothetical protein
MTSNDVIIAKLFFLLLEGLMKFDMTPGGGSMAGEASHASRCSGISAMFVIR